MKVVKIQTEIKHHIITKILRWGRQGPSPSSGAWVEMGDMPEGSVGQFFFAVLGFTSAHTNFNFITKYGLHKVNAY